MVTSDSARLDADNLFFNNDKIVLYHSVNETEDLTYGSQSLSYTTYSITMQGNITSVYDKMVKQGMISEGDAVGVLRYEYVKQTDGTSISPALIPKMHDEFTFLKQRFRIHKLTPLMSEDHNIILYSFEAKPVSTQEELNFPYTFPIQF
jgi:hypothetical protein